MLYSSGLGSAIAHLIGRPLIRLNNRQQAVEADFRFSPMDGVSCAAIEAAGLESWLVGIATELRTKTYQPQPVRRVIARCLRARLGAVSFDLDHRRLLVAAALLHGLENRPHQSPLLKSRAL